MATLKPVAVILLAALMIGGINKVESKKTDPEIVSTDPAPDETGPSLDPAPATNPPPEQEPADGVSAEQSKQ